MHWNLIPRSSRAIVCRLCLTAVLVLLTGPAPAQTDVSLPRRILWGSVLDRSSIDEVKAKYPSSFQWSESALPSPTAGESSPAAVVLKPSDQDVHQGLTRFQVGDGSILAIPTFQFRRKGKWQPTLVKVDLTVFSIAKPIAELRDFVRADMTKQFGPARMTKTGTMKDYGQMQFMFFEEAATHRVVCLTLPHDDKLPLSITYSFPAGGEDRWATDRRC